MDSSFFITTFWVTAVAVVLFSWWVLRPFDAPAGTLAYSKNARSAWLVFTALAFAVPVGLLALPAGPGKVGVRWADALGVGAMMSVLTLPVLLEFLRVRHRFDDVAVWYSTPWSRTRSFRWAEVQQIRFRPLAQWLDITDASGTAHHFSTMLAGRQLFATVALRRVPDAVLTADPLTHTVLRRMAEGVA